MKKFTLLLATMLLSVASFAERVVLFHESFGDNSKSAREWKDEYSTKTGVVAVYQDVVYAMEKVKQGKNTTGSTKSGLNQSSAGTDAVFISGPLHVADYSSLSVTYQWKAASVKGTYTTTLSYSIDGKNYTKVDENSGAKGATTFVKCQYSLPTEAQCNTLYLKVTFNTSNTQAIIDEFELTGETGPLSNIPATAIVLDQTSLSLEVGTSATLVATLTPADATTEVVWTSSDETVATVNNGVVNAVKAGNTTITATAGEGITATCEVTVKEQAPKALAEIDYTTDGTEYKLAPITVVYVNGKSIYVQDATGAGLIYGSALTVNAGDLVSGLVVTTKVFNKLPELETTATNEDVTIISGDAPSPVEATAAPVAAEVNKYLLLKGVVFAADATTLSGNYAQNVTASFKGEKVTIRDNFKITDGTILAGTYEIEGFVCLYNTTVQFYPTKITSTPTAIDNATVAEKAVKMIENGQLVIIREGVKYNAQGAVIR